MLKDIKNFLPLSDKLLSSGMPTDGQVDELAKDGVNLVINLAPFDPQQDLHDEGDRVHAAGMDYLNIPVEWHAPTRANLDAFMQAMESNRDRKVLVHCRANYRATGFIALYRVLKLGWKPEEAFQDLRRIWNPEDYPVWSKFLAENTAQGS